MSQSAVEKGLPFTQNRPLQVMVAWLLLFWLTMAIDPNYREDWMLENILVITFSLILGLSYRSFAFSNHSYLFITLFMTLHLIGAHYTYAETPFGYWLQEWFGWHRNHFDRLVHYSFGLLLALPLKELLLRAAGVKPAWSYMISIMLILSMGALFEVFEMLAALLVAPELGDAYLGTQGDVWDAQQDMMLATLGAMTALLIYRLWAWYKAI